MSGCRRKYLDKCLRGGARLNEFVWRFQRPRRARKNQVRTSVLSSASEAAASAKPSKGGKRSRTGPSQSPSDQRCAKRESLWLVASRSLCTRCCETERSSYRPKPAIHETGGRIQLPRGATPEGGSRRGDRRYSLDRAQQSLTAARRAASERAAMNEHHP